jgi:hypothetical protein
VKQRGRSGALEPAIGIGLFRVVRASGNACKATTIAKKRTNVSALKTKLSPPTGGTQILARDLSFGISIQRRPTL